MHRVETLVRDLGGLLGPFGLWSGSCLRWLLVNDTDVDISSWLSRVDTLLELVWFLSHLHWLSKAIDLGVGVFLMLNF